MAKAKFDRTKPHVNIGTIGHVDHLAGRASFTMEPSHYEEVPSNVYKAIVEKNAAAMANQR